MKESFYQISAQAALERLQTDPKQGLDTSEVLRRHRHYGYNVLEETRRHPAYHLFFRHFTDLLTVVLIIAAAFAYYLEDYHAGTILLVIILINAVISMNQEYKAERILEFLKTLIKVRATVIRAGKRMIVAERELVPGDIVFLEEGSAVPADVRLVETNNFSTNDFILTGESLPQEKRADLVITEETSVTNQDNLALFGTTVARGNALGVVYATGMNSAIGNIARISQTIKRDLSPLQREINTLARTLTKLAGVIALSMFVLNFFLRGDEFENLQTLVNTSLLFAIGVAAACVPQGLPAQISVALSLGVGRLARKHAVVKRLSAVESLGCTTVICSDKTGTITANEMTIVHFWTSGRNLDVIGDGYNPEGHILEDGNPLSAQALISLRHFFADGFLSGRGRTHAPDQQHHTWHAIGDPTEAAFMPLAIKAGLDPEYLEKSFRLIQEFPFDGDRKRMTMIREHKGHLIGYMKGALVNVLECCSGINDGGVVRPLTGAERAVITGKNDEFSAQSLRVIALAYRDFPEGLPELSVQETEKEFVFAGLVAMFDPPRRGVKAAVQAVLDAHIRMIMITGDDPATAKAIAALIGLHGGGILTGDDMNKLTDPELKHVLREHSLVFSRVSAMDKYRIVRLLKQMGEVVAVTGDGVNDTLSLKQADIGVAMGKLGSDVAKAAAEIVLVDDNFSTLVVAIQEGRTIFQNLKNVILSSINANLGELSVVCLGFAGVALGMPAPITAVQILAVDLIGELLPLMAVTFDPPQRTAMERPPRNPEEHIVNRRSLVDLFFFGILMGGAAYFSFYMVQKTGGSTGMSQAAAYASIVLIQFANILSRRTPQSVFNRSLFSNRYLWYALSVSFAIVLMLVNVPAIGVWFGFEPMRFHDWLWPVSGALLFLCCFEARKFLFR